MVNKILHEWKTILKISQTVEIDISGPGKKDDEYLLQGLKKEAFYQYKTGIKDSQERFAEVQAQIDKFSKALQNYENLKKMLKKFDKIKQEVVAIQLLWEY